MSTLEPVGVPRWEAPADAPDFDAILDHLAAPASAASTTPEANTALTLDTPEMGGLGGWQTYAPTPTPEKERNADLMKLLSGIGAATGSVGRGNYGLSAYGASSSGQPSQRGSGKYGLQQPFWTALSRAFADMDKAGLGSAGVTDGFRDYAGQVAAKRKWIAKGNPNAAATPGRSVHGLGWAADLSLNKAQWKWLRENGPRYGIHNFPGVTRYGQTEFWHFQYDPKLARSGKVPKFASSAPTSPRPAPRISDGWIDTLGSARQRGLA